MSRQQQEIHKPLLKPQRSSSTEIMRSSLSLSEKTNTTDEEIPPDNKMIQSLINMKNLILQKMRMSSNNLLTFARAHPMVYLSKKEGVKPCNNDTKSCDFNMKGHVL